MFNPFGSLGFITAGRFYLFTKTNFTGGCKRCKKSLYMGKPFTVEFVITPTTFLADFYKVCCLQEPKMVRKGGLFEIEVAEDVACTQLATGKDMDDLHPCFIRKGFE